MSKHSRRAGSRPLARIAALVVLCSLQVWPGTSATAQPESSLARPVGAVLTPGQKAVGVLKKAGFRCEGPRGVVRLVQCRKGTVKVPRYGTQPRESVNLMLNDPEGGESIYGYALPRTAKLLRPFGVKNTGDDGSGTGVVNVEN